MDILLISLAFVLIALSAGQIGRYFTLARLPLISGFLFTGILAGPFVLDFISSEALQKLRFIDQISLAFIAFAAVVRTITHAEFPYEILLEPLLICMAGSFIAVNFSDYRAEFRKILQDIGPSVYVVFFTLTGASLALNVLAASKRKFQEHRNIQLNPWFPLCLYS